MKSFKKLLVVFSILGLCITGCSNGQTNKYKDDKRYDIYQLALADGYEGTYEQWLESIKGPAGQDGADGKDGHTPIINIGDDGYWYIDGVNTHVKAQGDKGDTGPQGSQGPKGDTGPSGSDGVSVVSIEKTSSDGLIDTYTIIYSNGNTSAFTITNGQNGQDGAQGQQGPQGQQGIQGNPGADGHTPIITISANGNWVVDGVDTGIKAQGDKGDTGPQGEPGADGSSVLTGNGTPSNLFGNNGDSYIDLDSWNYYVKSNNEWFLKGNIKGSTGSDGQNGVSVVSIAYTSSNGLVDTYTITYSDGKTSTFTVTNGVNGNDGADGQSIQGQPGQDGHTPIITIGDTGNWYVDGVDTGIKAQGPQGEIGPQGPKGDTGISVVSTSIDENGDLIVTFSDGIIQNAGHVKDVDKCTVNFYVDDDLVATREVLKGQKVSRPTEQEIAGYTVSDWYYIDGSSHESWKFFGYVITEDTNLFADFTYNEYLISFVDSKFDHVVDSITVTYDKPFNLPPINQTGYTFAGWKHKDEILPNSGTYRIASDIVLYAVWDANTYEVSFNPNGGTLEQTSMIVIYDSPYSFPTPSRLNYVFLGWFDGDNRISSNATWRFIENKNLIAKWTNITNTYVLDPGDGTCEIASMIIGWEDEYELPTPVLSNYYFVGWYLNNELIPQNGIWTYSNCGGILEARWSEHLTIQNNIVIKCDLDAVSVSVPDYVTSIEEYAFRDCINLVSLSIPNSIESIGDYAFYNCESLEFNEYDNAKYLGDNDNPFVCLVKAKHTTIDTCSIAQSCKFIYNKAFENCNRIKTIKIPDSVISISKFAFYKCDSLENISVPFLGKSIDANAYEATFGYIFGYKESANPSTNTTEYSYESSLKFRSGLYGTCPEGAVGQYSCRDYLYGGRYYNGTYYYYIPSTIKNVVVTKQTTLPIAAFNNCSFIENIDLPESMELISERSFSNCSSLADININSSNAIIEQYAFASCYSLKNLIIDGSNARIDTDAFTFCKSLIYIAFYGVSTLSTSAFEECKAIETIILARCVTSVGLYPFSYCNPSLTIYCEAESRPSGWSGSWDNYDYGGSIKYSVVWGYVLS